MAFLGAAQNNDLEALVALLRADVTLGCDHGGKAKAVHKPLIGADHVARYFAGMALKGARMGVDLRVAWLHFGLGLLAFEEGRLTTAIAFEIDIGVGIDGDGARVAKVHVTRNPDKLESDAAEQA